jgi:L-threonylcarbamoyladenylate synthase
MIPWLHLLAKQWIIGYLMSNSPFLSNCTADTIRDAAAALKAGHLVAFPTETVYGLGADARNPDAVKRIYDVKGRPVDHPLIVHISSINQVERWASEIPDYAIALARNFWPGPMTLIFKRSPIAQDFITGGQETVGLRIPSDPIALALIAEFERIADSAIAAPSANRFGHVSPTAAHAVSVELSDYLSEDDLILDGGACTVGVESTIVDCTGNSPRILRPGAITEEMIVDATGFSLACDASPVELPEIRVSGSLESHYSPLAIVLLDQSPIPGQGFIALADIPTPEGVIRLASPKNSEEFARVLYASLRAADEKRLQKVVVKQPQGNGIAIAIRNRLTRAANGR